MLTHLNYRDTLRFSQHGMLSKYTTSEPWRCVNDGTECIACCPDDRPASWARGHRRTPAKVVHVSPDRLDAASGGKSYVQILAHKWVFKDNVNTRVRQNWGWSGRGSSIQEEKHGGEDWKYYETPR